jgi:hypothetical protein
MYFYNIKKIPYFLEKLYTPPHTYTKNRHNILKYSTGRMIIQVYEQNF